MIDDKELAQLFKTESAEYLARLDDGLLRLEKTPANQPLLEEVFRESHSLKGAARMLGLSKIEAAAHGLETILNTARKGETPQTSRLQPLASHSASRRCGWKHASWTICLPWWVNSA